MSWEELSFTLLIQIGAEGALVEVEPSTGKS